MPDSILRAKGPAGPIFACVSADARFVEGRPCGSRLGAALAPFTDEAAAKAALVAAGGVLAAPDEARNRPKKKGGR